MKYFQKHGISVSPYIVLDVTWDTHLGNAATIENVALGEKNKTELGNAINQLPQCPKIVKDNFFDDETRTYMQGECFSLCAPVYDSFYMHSNKGCRINENMFAEYSKVLPSIANHLAQSKTQTKLKKQTSILLDIWKLLPVFHF